MMMLAFVSITHSSTILPAEFMTAMEMLSLWTFMPIYFVLSIGDAPFGKQCREREKSTREKPSLDREGAGPIHSAVFSFPVWRQE
jgi:hypothetical protein